MKRVLFFGIYDPGYSRNRILMRGFQENGWDVRECRVDPRSQRGLRKYLALWRAARAMRHESLDMVLVAFPGHTVVWLARLALSAPIIFDAFVSLYDSNVEDRQRYRRYDPRALRDWMLDWLSVRAADRVLLDTQAHIDYFVARYGADPARCIRIWVGTDESVFYPRAAESVQDDLVHFHGTFIPLQGVDTILAAAQLLGQNAVTIALTGRGQQYAQMRLKAHALSLTNVEFLDPVAYEALPDRIAPAALCLGIFGTTDKAARVIPNKVFECLAMGKPVITRDSPAVRELSLYGPLPLVLVAPGDPEALARAIRALREDPDRRRQLGDAARSLVAAHLTPRALVAEFLAAYGTPVARP